MSRSAKGRHQGKAVGRRFSRSWPSPTAPKAIALAMHRTTAAARLRLGWRKSAKEPVVEHQLGGRVRPPQAGDFAIDTSDRLPTSCHHRPSQIAIAVNSCWCRCGKNEKTKLRNIPLAAEEPSFATSRRSKISWLSEASRSSSSCTKYMRTPGEAAFQLWSAILSIASESEA